RSLIDPSQTLLRKEPRNSEDLIVSAQNNWVIAIDNMSHLPDWLSDDLCRLSTGGGISKRELYSNDSEFILDAKRPAIMNGIAEFVARGDLASRSIVLNLPQIINGSRKREKILEQEFIDVWPELFGCLCRAVSLALRNEGCVNLNENLRMTDAWHWVTAGERALGIPNGDTVRAYQNNQAAANEVVLASSPVYPLLRSLVAQGGWSGSPSDLLSKLNSMRVDSLEDRSFPRNSRALTDHIRRINPALRKANILVYLDGRTSGSNSERRITIEQTHQSSVANVANVAISNGNTPCDARDANLHSPQLGWDQRTIP
ncbi:hypothetical protein EBZ37_10315, partial [bacterium]|nr:hypothetical protein [bacterium]